jgi:hypothetical protein
MRFRLRLGKSGKMGHLTPEQAAVLKRLEAGELTDEEAAAQLGGSVRTWKWSFGTDEHEPEREAAEPEPAAEPAHDAEDDAARALVERIAREVDAGE